MDLQQVDIVHSQATQAIVNGSHDLRARQPLRQIADLMINFGGDDHRIAASILPQRAAEDLFAAAVGVVVRGIEEVNSAFQRTFNQRTATLFWQRPGMIAAVRFAEGHAAETESGNAKMGIAKRNVVHKTLLLL